MRPEMAISLREVTAEMVHAICRLTVRPEQRRFVAANEVSLAQAHFDPTACCLAVCAGETPVGFLMYHADQPQVGAYYLRRFMIAAEHQGQGYGRRALRLLIDRLCSRPGAQELRLGYLHGEGNPRAFYARLGFVETGELNGDEIVMRLPFV